MLPVLLLPLWIDEYNVYSIYMYVFIEWNMCACGAFQPTTSRQNQQQVVALVVLLKKAYM